MASKLIALITITMILQMNGTYALVPNMFFTSGINLAIS